MSPRRAWRLVRIAPVLLVLAGLGSASAAPPAGKPVFIQVQGFAPTSIGQNGFVVAGNFTEGGTFQWMPTSGVAPTGGGQAFVSRDGKAMVGTMDDPNAIQQAVRWEGGTSWRMLGPLAANAVPCGDIMSIANGTSADGRVVVGGGYYGTRLLTACDFTAAFRWEESTGYVLMPSPQVGGQTRANAVSADGRVIVGVDQYLIGDSVYQQLTHGVKWVDGKYELIKGGGPLGTVSSAETVNRDGTLIAGSGCTFDPILPNKPQTAWSWTAAGGVQCHTAEPPLWVLWARDNLYNVSIRGVSDDGRVMAGDIGYDISHGEEESVIWFDGEPVFLRDYLRGNGYPDAFEGHANTGRITAVSPDGRVLAGHNGGPFGAINRYGFILILPELGKK